MSLAGCHANKPPPATEALNVNQPGQPEMPPPEPQPTSLSDSEQIQHLQSELSQARAEIARLEHSNGRSTNRHSGPAAKLDGLNSTYDSAAGTLTVIVPGKTLFDSGSAKLKAESHPILDKIAAAIKREYRNHRVYVDGHTDSTPIKSSKWANNHDLAAARALSVAAYLMGKGIPEMDIVVRSYGAINPKGSKEASRRVEIVVQVH